LEEGTESLSRPRAGAAFVAALALVAAVGEPGQAERCVRYLDAATSRVESAVRVFESKPSEDGAAIDAAKTVLELARRARSELEGSVAPPGCAYSRSEELIYLNHLIPGFEGWLAAHGRRPPVDYELASIIRRARAHRQRGREKLK
jgi:hypothetical protein